MVVLAVAIARQRRILLRVPLHDAPALPQLPTQIRRTLAVEVSSTDIIHIRGRSSCRITFQLFTNTIICFIILGCLCTKPSTRLSMISSRSLSPCRRRIDWHVSGSNYYFDFFSDATTVS